MDKDSIANQQISSDALMERAGGCCADWLLNQFGISKPYEIICGNGNNGGDGLVIARLLTLAGAKVSIWIFKDAERSDDNQLNLARLTALNIVQHEMNDASLKSQVLPGAILIDAFIGSGLKQPLRENTLGVILWMNAQKKTALSLISIDCPSGFNADAPPTINSAAVMADFTLSFHCPKLMFFFEESYKFTGQWEVLDIGLDKDLGLASQYEYLLHNDLEGIIKPRYLFSHKGYFGHALIAGGSKGHCGAVVLAAKSCLRAGAGLVTCLLPGDCVTSFHGSCDEAMTISSSEAGHIAPSPILVSRFSTVAFGPGAGKHDDTARLLKYLIQEATTPMVIDADGINILAENMTWLSFIPPGSILTPHPREFDRMAGNSVNTFERMEKAIELARLNDIIIVLKDAFTRIIFPDGRVYFNSTGNPGMATGGSGDVLTGIIAGLLAQGLSSENAAKLGVFLHGLSGDIAIENGHEQSMVAGDLISCLPQAWRRLA
ncbi:MAG: NAD(P)H-hydrate dehydratase [Bacteroidia bacterium]|nr:NAD(P)H-hydrate dehydratase [Bacteroidia bacterium]